MREEVGFAAVLWRLRHCVSCLPLYRSQCESNAIPNCFLWNPYKVKLFPIAISHHSCRSWSMEQRCDGCDDDDAMVRQYVGNDVMTMVLWYDDVTMKRWSIPLSLSHHRTISTHCAHALFLWKWRQVWILIRHTNYKKYILHRSFIPETLIFLAVMNAVTHSRKMERGNFIRAHYKVLLLPWFCSSCIHLKTKQTYWLKCIIKSTMHLIQACRVFD